MPAATITIVMPVRDRAALMQRTLRSIEGQTHRPLSVIIVDDGSADDTLAVAQSWAESVKGTGIEATVLSQPPQGAAAARNLGLEHVSTLWTMHFDSDDEMQPTHVERALECAAAHPSAMIVGWDVRLHKLDGSTAVLPFAVASPVYECVMHGTMATQRYMARTSLLREVGGWSPDLMVWNDIELGVRLLRGAQGRITKAKGQPTVDVHATAASITGVDYSSKGQMRELSLLRIESHGVDVSLRRATLAADYAREGRADMARTLLRQALDSEPKTWRRAMLRLAYAYASRGGRGIARVLKPIMNRER